MPRLGTSIRITSAVAAAALLAVVVAAAASAKPGHRATTLQGAGSSLIAPAIQGVWAPQYSSATGTTINYASVGSGAGIAQITARTVDFGASDAPLTTDQATACDNCVQIPWALTATVPSYNIPGVKDTQLRLTGPVLANIFLGKITKWNDPAVKAINPKVNLPDLAITVAHRSDGSGDTYAFTDYLSKVSPTWKAQVGNATAVNWPVGVGGKGNPGVAAIISSTPGAIGYISDAYVLQNHIAKARIKNAAGYYTLPGLTGIEDAAQSVTTVPADNKMSIVDPPGVKKFKAAYPLSTFTYIIVPMKTPNASAIRQFVFWALTKGQPPIKKLIFAPIPKVVLVAAEKTLTKIHS